MGGDNSVDVVAFGGVEVEVGNEEKKIDVWESEGGGLHLDLFLRRVVACF
jgi:hypothetical protein